MGEVFRRARRKAWARRCAEVDSARLPATILTHLRRFETGGASCCRAEPSQHSCHLRCWLRRQCALHCLGTARREEPAPAFTWKPIPVREASRLAPFQIARRAYRPPTTRSLFIRDLKPENLFLTLDGRVKILGISVVAKLQTPPADDRSIESMTTVTKHGAMIGTGSPTCLAEQLRGKAVDHRSDIFTFGAILYEMMAGSRAFRGETEVDTISPAVLREEPASAIWTKLRFLRGIRTSSGIVWKRIRRTVSRLRKTWPSHCRRSRDRRLSGSLPRLRQRRAPTRVLPWAVVAGIGSADRDLAITSWYTLRPRLRPTVA